MTEQNNIQGIQQLQDSTEYYQVTAFDVTTKQQVVKHSFTTLKNYFKIIGFAFIPEGNFFTNLATLQTKDYTHTFELKIDGKVIIPEGTPAVLFATTTKAGSTNEILSDYINQKINSSLVEIVYKDNTHSTMSDPNYTMNVVALIKK